jgi:hypothetical protein
MSSAARGPLARRPLERRGLRGHDRARELGFLKGRGLRCIARDEPRADQRHSDERDDELELHGEEPGDGCRGENGCGRTQEAEAREPLLPVAAHALAQPRQAAVDATAHRLHRHAELARDLVRRAPAQVAEEDRGAVGLVERVHLVREAAVQRELLDHRERGTLGLARGDDRLARLAPRARAPFLTHRVAQHRGEPRAPRRTGARAALERARTSASCTASSARCGSRTSRRASERNHSRSSRRSSCGEEASPMAAPRMPPGWAVPQENWIRQRPTRLVAVARPHGHRETL